ncbi:hypothetical protein F3Y22_tig00112738pilonHSYRG00727 [Hibiscus syriacus]|uniref:Uncharacterized protein n=1 Tax=Hibiscus syriacus TaxID=106335 RepID=A0A6A2Y3Y1_HIBSY|nr:hypothetical protein F3Y22_tig00112738pilonHSYRG00727 [Hibiscus syriacus]
MSVQGIFGGILNDVEPLVRRYERCIRPVGLLQPTPRCPIIRVRVALRESQLDLRLYPLVGEESGVVSGALLDMGAMLRRNGRSAGGRVIDPHRSSLGTKMVDMLVCGADCKTKISYMLRFLENEDE